jgi:REP element-mobilizing transposase RayT
MPRQLRVEFPGAIYHVMSRDDRREDIFRDDVGRQDFLRTLAETCQKTGFEVHAYCLMLNHFHLVVETPEANLVAGMHWLLSAYTIRFNHRHQLHGHVFSGRYKALLIEASGNGGAHGDHRLSSRQRPSRPACAHRAGKRRAGSGRRHPDLWAIGPSSSHIRHQTDVIEQILRHCGLWDEPSARPPPAAEMSAEG